jgi:hypothetical protein
MLPMPSEELVKHLTPYDKFARWLPMTSDTLAYKKATLLKYL